MKTRLAKRQYARPYSNQFSLVWLPRFNSVAVPFVSLQMPSSTGNRKFQTNAMKAYRKQRQYNFRHCQPCHVTHAQAVIWSVCLLMLPMLELATERAQLTTTCRMNPINHGPVSRSHTPLVLPFLNSVLPAMVLQNRVNIECLSYISIVRHVPLSPAPTVPTSLGRRVVGVVVLLLLLMSGDIEMNPGPVGE